MYELKKPCKSCPFLKENEGAIGEDRLHDIIDSLMKDDYSSFTCHNTIDYSTDMNEDEDFMPSTAKGHQQCAGAMLVLEKAGRLTVGMRVAVVTGMYDRKNMLKHLDKVVDPEDIGIE